MRAFRLAARGVTSLPLLELGALLAVSILYLYNAVRSALPPGSSGLYALMMETVLHHPFPMPQEVEFYGPGGIPFAYPPLGFYLGSLVIAAFRISPMAYMRWAPPLMTIAAMVGVYFLGRQLFEDRLRAIVAAMVVSTAEMTYVLHATAPGIVRGLALLWAVFGAAFAVRAFREGKPWSIFGMLAGLCLALAAMAHLSYAFFLVSGIVLIALFPPRHVAWRNRALLLGTIGAISLAVSAPWWVTVTQRYGPAVFLNAQSTHGTFDFMERVGWDPILIVLNLREWLLNLGDSWWPGLLGPLALAGLAYAIAGGKWLIPLWMFVVAVALGESDRFQILLGGLLVGDLLVDIARLTEPRQETIGGVGKGTVKGWIFLGLVLAIFLNLGMRGFRRADWPLSPVLMDATTFMRDETPSDSRYIFLGESLDVAEWIPYLARRTPAVAHWGAEWTGGYYQQFGLTGQIEHCVGAQSFQCVKDLLETLDSEVEVLLVRDKYEYLVDEIRRDVGWDEIYRNDQYVVFQSRG
jgi:hypothetical protein